MSKIEVMRRNVDKLKLECERTFRSKTRSSEKLWLRYRNVSPAGVSYAIRFTKPYPLFLSKAYGTEVVDVDGNIYVDFWMGHGVHILGHSPWFILEEVCNAVREYGSTHLGFEHPLVVDYAELLTKTVPNLEMVRFTNSGTEAVMYATRLARAYTGRRFIVKMEGGWHGGFDSLHYSVHPPFGEAESAGLSEETVKYTISTPFNDLDSVEDALRKHDVACVIVEPVPGAGGCLEPEPGFLNGLRELCDKYGSLLVFDEVFTGFRLAPGGAQEFFNVRADIVIYGKVVGGGFPGAGAFGGRAEVMSLIDHTKHSDPRKRSFHGGTFVGNIVTVSAGYAMVRFLNDNRELYGRANELWSRVRSEMGKLCGEFGNVCWVTGVSSMIGLHFTDKKPRNVREAYERRLVNGVEETLNIYSRVKGLIYLTEKMPHFLPSLTHGEGEARKLLNVFSSFLNDLSST